jgi:hypothetical protein
MCRIGPIKVDYLTNSGAIDRLSATFTEYLDDANLNDCRIKTKEGTIYII